MAHRQQYTEPSRLCARAALKAPECGNGDACVGAPRCEVLPQLAITVQRTDLDLHPIPELWEVLVVGLVQGMSFRNAHTEVVEVQ